MGYESSVKLASIPVKCAPCPCSVFQCFWQSGLNERVCVGNWARKRGAVSGTYFCPGRGSEVYISRMATSSM
eukprot:6213326-Pleurochrysis_carterae.AAC.2